MGAKKAPETQTQTAVATISQPIPRPVQATMVLAAVLGLLFVRPYWGTILFSALIAFTFNPVYKAVLRRTKRQGLALPATLAAAFLSVIVPLALVVGVTVNQASSLVAKFQSGDINIGTAQVGTVVDRSTERVNDLVHGLPGGKSFKLDRKKVINNLKQAGEELLQALITFVKQAGGAVVGLISRAILALFLVIAMLRYQAELLQLFRKLSPFHDSVTDLYVSKAGAMTKAMVKGQLVIAVAQGFASAFSLWIVGLDYFWFFAVVLTFLSFIPLGGGILTIPIGIILMFTGHIPQGIFVILFHLLVVSNIDNLLRPQLVPKSAQLNSALVLLSVFSGLAVFGTAGVIYGPVVMILLVTTFQMYADYNSRIKKPLPPK